MDSVHIQQTNQSTISFIRKLILVRVKSRTAGLRRVRFYQQVSSKHVHLPCECHWVCSSTALTPRGVQSLHNQKPNITDLHAKQSSNFRNLLQLYVLNTCLLLDLEPIINIMVVFTSGMLRLHRVQKKRCH